MTTTTGPCPSRGCEGTFTTVSDEGGARGSCDRCPATWVTVHKGALDLGLVRAPVTSELAANNLTVFHEEWTGFQVLRDLPTGDGRQP